MKRGNYSFDLLMLDKILHCENQQYQMSLHNWVRHLLYLPLWATIILYNTGSDNS